MWRQIYLVVFWCVLADNECLREYHEYISGYPDPNWNLYLYPTWVHTHRYKSDHGLEFDTSPSWLYQLLLIASIHQISAIDLWNVYGNTMIEFTDYLALLAYLVLHSHDSWVMWIVEWNMGQHHIYVTNFIGPTWCQRFMMPQPNGIQCKEVQVWKWLMTTILMSLDPSFKGKVA